MNPDNFKLHIGSTRSEGGEGHSDGVRTILLKRLSLTAGDESDRSKMRFLPTGSPLLSMSIPFLSSAFAFDEYAPVR
jgi:hypothetical protein